MRFAITLLTVIAIASVIGTVLQQNQPYPAYTIEFGPFWFEVFRTLGLYDVYHAGWFLAILLFLVISTSLCIYRNLPGMLKDMRSFREHAGESSLKSFSHHAILPIGDPAAPLSALSQYLTAKGYRFKQQDQTSGAILLAGKTGSAQRLGYFFAHAAIVLICIGGLIDGNIPLQLQQLTGSKRAETRDIPQSQVPTISRLPQDTLSFRGNVTIPAGSETDVMFINVGNGYMVQELPFSIKLKQFHIEHYSTGQPKLFASDVVVTDKATGTTAEGTVKVNHPLIFNGAAIYQASFGDGGSGLELAQWALRGDGTQPVPFKSRSQTAISITLGSKPYTLEFGDFRPFNIENFSKNPEPSSGMAGQLASAVENAMQVRSEKSLRNVGPSIQFKLRDETGQAREYMNYMQPVLLDGQSYFVSGMRTQPGDPFQYLRIPADDNLEINGFMRLKAVLTSPQHIDKLVDATRKTILSADAMSAKSGEQFALGVSWVLSQFAKGGFPALDKTLRDNVPQDKRDTIARTYLQILQGVAVEADKLSREQAGLPVKPMTPEHFRFIVDSLVAISTSFDYGEPVYLQLTGFDEVKASGFQVTRAPGQNIVYLGSLMLILGVFAMFYIRERRVFILIKPEELVLAMSANRKHAEFEREFKQIRQDIEQITQIARH
ncbi:cytochrome c biogenesis protein ResB [Chitinivorax sp. B]|uniref:cytochrome c biogenesis protein ResB n=1 Tax=Chitinivorax sp. B TaxID=2502235 RepID=UPI0010F7FA26|nr:cytochrome c biogenesis protein ResB [Chitinivorax sp. B]